MLVGHLQYTEAALMTLLNRRAFLSQSGRMMGGGLAAFAALQFSTVGCAKEAVDSATRSPGYGPLRSAGPELSLPEGFQYKIIGVQGSKMSDGRLTPTMHDGMA